MVAIEKGIPAPSPRPQRYKRRESLIPEHIEIGDSFQLSLSAKWALWTSITKEHRGGDRRFTTRTEADSYTIRCWRVE